MKRNTINNTLSICAWLLLVIAPCRAQIVFDVSLDTTPLQSATNGPFAIDFQLIDSSGLGDANNSATAGSISFGSGAPTGSPTLFGGAAGDLSSLVTLTDSSPFNEFSQPFTPGNALQFRLDLTDALDADGSSDQFAFALLDGTGAAIPTLGPGDALLTVDLASGVTQSFGTAPGAAVALAAPTVIQPVPEPGAAASLFAGAFGVVIFRLKRRR